MPFIHSVAEQGRPTESSQLRVRRDPRMRLRHPWTGRVDNRLPREIIEDWCRSSDRHYSVEASATEKSPYKLAEAQSIADN